MVNVRNYTWKIAGYSVGALRQDVAAWAAVQELDQTYSFAPWPPHAWENLREPYYLALANGQARANGRPLGFALVQKGWDGELHLINLTVHPAARRQGIGQALLQYLQQLPGIASIYLEVAVSNTSALQLYGKLGFAKLCCKKAFYQNGEAAFALQWKRGGT